MRTDSRSIIRDLGREDPRTGPGEGDRTLHDMLIPVVGLLTDPDEARRRDAMGRIKRGAIPALRSMLIDRLIDVLRSRDTSACERAVASLVEFGEDALPALYHAALQARKPALQKRLVEVLCRVGCELSPRRRVWVQLHLDVMLSRVRDEGVIASIRDAQARLRPAPGAPQG